MKKYWSRLLAGVVVGCGALLAGARPASAQDLRTVAVGHFTLPYEVHWKESVLPPGDYTFDLRSNYVWMTVGLHGPSGTTHITGSAINIEHSKESSKLKIERREGAEYVKDLYLEPVGLHIRYDIPKMPKSEKLMAKGQSRPDRTTVALSDTIR